VFVFGLIHGLGFAGFFGELGLPEGLFFSSLIGFNLGVEAGQIAVIGITAMVAGLANWLMRTLAMSNAYRYFITRSASALIGLIGLYWGCERLLGVG
jgi:small-conductance mechanosensitive channel